MISKVKFKSYNFNKYSRKNFITYGSVIKENKKELRKIYKIIKKLNKFNKRIYDNNLMTDYKKLIGEYKECNHESIPEDSILKHNIFQCKAKLFMYRSIYYNNILSGRLINLCKSYLI